MSKLKVSAIHDPDNDNQALSIDTSGNVSVSQNTTMSGNLTVSGGFTPATQLSHRNLIINGAMEVAQRGTSWSSLQNSPQYGADRFSYRRGGTWSSVSFTLSVESDSPNGFTKSLKLLSSGTQSPSTENASFSYFWEGQDLQQLGYGTADAKTMTLSFWVKSSLTGKVSVGFNNDDNSESYYSYVTVNSANTWEYKTVTITGDTANTITNDNTTGVKLNIAVSSGTSEPTLNQWTAGTLRGFGTSGEGYIDIAGTSGASMQITGVQLEVGSVATPFEHRSYGEELARCQRYYNRQTVSAGYQLYWSAYSGDYDITWVQNFPVVMRAAPTMTEGGNWYDSGNFGEKGPRNITTYGYVYLMNPTSAGRVYRYADTNAYLEMDAEL